MPKRQKIPYDAIMDNKVSFDQYNDLTRSDNSRNIKERCEILQLIIDECLTEKQRKILNMYYKHGLNISEISRKMNRNKSTISRSLKKSRETISKYMRYSNFR